MPGFIYGLADPVSEEIRYIGMTEFCPQARLKAHVKQSSPRSLKHNPKVLWLRSLAVEPKLVIIEFGEWTRDELAAREQWWIANMRSWGNRLTNLTDGGDGYAGKRGPQTEEHKRKLSESNKRRWSEATKAERKELAAAVVLKRRFQCGECELVTNVGAITLHQRSTMHTGKVDVAQ